MKHIAIAEQNQILSAYYGDIVEVCNQIYQRLGDMQQTQIEANELLSSLVSLLNSTTGKLLDVQSCAAFVIVVLVFVTVVTFLKKAVLGR